jgi:hypothetical protein
MLGKVPEVVEGNLVDRETVVKRISFKAWSASCAA